MKTLAITKGACVTRPNNPALCFPDLTIKQRDRILLTGASGCGKTTLLRLLAGLVAPDAGSVNIQTDRLAYVFQEPRLIPGLSAADNLRITTGANTVTIHDMMRRMGLGAVMARPARDLSGGEATRVNLLRALLTPSDLILVDEGGSGLDADSLSKAQDVAQDCLRGRSPAIIEVVHFPQQPIVLGETAVSIALPAHDVKGLKQR